jgi:hypothetical protein
LVWGHIGTRNSDVLLGEAVLFVEGDVLHARSETLGMSLDESNGSLVFIACEIVRISIATAQSSG